MPDFLSSLFGGGGSSSFSPSGSAPLNPLMPSGSSGATPLSPFTPIASNIWGWQQHQGDVLTPILRGASNVFGAIASPLLPSLKPAAPAVTPVTPGGPLKSAQYRPLIDAVAARYTPAGVDPTDFADGLQALIETENSGPEQTSVSGARGVTQTMPNWYEANPTYGWAQLDPNNLNHQIEAGARAYNAKLQGVGPNLARAAGAYFGYGTDPLGMTTGHYIPIWQGNYNAIRAGRAPGAPPAAATTPWTAGTDPTPNQFGDAALTPEEAIAACGPAAAIAFAHANGQMPTLRQAVDIAKQVGWQPGAQGGMAGPQSQVALLNKMGITAHLVPNVDWNNLAMVASPQQPVILSTPNHYFVVYGYDPATGAYRVGNSGTALKGGAAELTAQQITQLGGGYVQGAIFLGA